MINEFNTLKLYFFKKRLKIAVLYDSDFNIKHCNSKVASILSVSGDFHSLQQNIFVLFLWTFYPKKQQLHFLFRLDLKSSWRKDYQSSTALTIILQSKKPPPLPA